MIIIDGGLTFAKVFETGTDSKADGYTNSNGTTLTLPSNAQDGDFAVLIDMPVNNAAALPTFVTPTSWTNTINTSGSSGSGNGVRVNVSHKILTSADVGAVITGMVGAGFARKILLTLRPSRPIQTATKGGWTARCDNSVPGSILVPAAAAATPGTAVVVIGLAVSENAVSPFTWTPAADETNSSVLQYRAGFKLYQTDVTPADHTIEMQDGGVINGLAAGYFVFT